MKNKYIKFFKKELIFLLLLLIVVFISFGITYANFIYNSEDKRAVEMFTGSLSYNLKINDTYQSSLIVNPGSSILNIEIESTNEISTYYKLLTNSDVTIYAYDGLVNGTISSGEKTNIKLYVINNSSVGKAVSFVVSMGYITNTLDDVIIKDGYREIENIKKEITYDKKKWFISKINEDSSIDLISKDVYITKISGYKSYNDLNNLLNSKCTTLGSRSIDVNDLDNLIINTDKNYTELNRLIYYPSIFRSNNVVIEDDNVNENGYGYTNHILVKNKNISFTVSNEILKQNKYLLNTNYYEIDNNKILYYVIEMDNGNLVLRKLYDSNNTNYEVSSNVRCTVNIKNTSF